MIDERMIQAEIPHLRRYARALAREPEAADDLVQDTLERAWRKRHLWRPHGRLRSWLFRILYRMYLDHRPRLQRRNHKLISLEEMAAELPGRVSPNHPSLYCQDVFRAMDQLPEKHRAILLLVALEQPGYTEGARILGIQKGTFRSRLSRARDHLNEELACRETPAQDKEALT